jgi:hypothetical protein
MSESSEISLISDNHLNDSQLVEIQLTNITSNSNSNSNSNNPDESDNVNNVNNVDNNMSYCIKVTMTYITIIFIIIGIIFTILSYKIIVTDNYYVNISNTTNTINTTSYDYFYNFNIHNDKCDYDKTEIFNFIVKNEAPNKNCKFHICYDDHSNIMLSKDQIEDNNVFDCKNKSSIYSWLSFAFFISPVVILVIYVIVVLIVTLDKCRKNNH